LGPGSIPTSTPRSWRRRIALLTAVAVTPLIIAAVIDRLGEAPDLDQNRVVVLPLANRTGDTALALLGSMAADWITQGLQEIEVIEVVPTATGVEPGPSIAGIEGLSEVSAAQVAAEATGARTVVAGSYYRRGDSLEFQTQVIDASTDRLVRAMIPVTGPISHPGGVLDSLRGRAVATVAAALDRRLFPSTAVSRLPTLEAYRTNLGEWSAADSNAQLLIPFRSQFSPYQRATLDWQLAGLRGDRAAALDAARARGVLADLGVEAFRFNRPYEAIEALRPVTDWPEFGFNYFKWTTLMEAYHVVDDYQQELTEARRARELYPDRMLMLSNEVRALAALGRIDEVDRLVGESLRLPIEGGITTGHVMGIVAGELRAHGYRAASRRVTARHLDWFDSRPAYEKESIPYRVGLAQTLYSAERWDEARSLFEELAAELPRDVNVQGYLGTLAARLGDREEALRTSDQLVGMAGPHDFGRDIYWQACIAAQLGELERAMVLLRESYARGRVFSLRLHLDTDLEPLHGYPPYEEFIEPKR
jgi:tetratricopeptide (TPR) repeat protein/TolB-like protein